MKLTVHCLLAAIAATAPAHAVAQAFPTKAIRLVVPFSTGSTADLLGRVVATRLSEAWGRQVVIDNRAGAGGNLGIEIVAKAPADGYTLLIAASSLTINPTLYGRVSYDPVRDFAAVTQIASAPQLFTVTASLPASSIRELIALAAAKPGQIRYGSGGNGSQSHLAVELFSSMTGVKLVHVPYKGGDSTIIGLLTGEVQLTCGSIRLVMPQVKAGKLKALAVTSATRSPAIPDIPTIAESGVPGYDMTAWWGVVAPAKTPKAIIDRLHDEIARQLQVTEVRERLASFGVDTVGNSPEAFGTFIRREVKLWAKIVKESGARVD